MRRRGQIKHQKSTSRHRRSQRFRFGNLAFKFQCRQHHLKIEDRVLVLNLFRLLPLVLVLFHGKVAGFVNLAQLPWVFFGGVKPVPQP